MSIKVTENFYASPSNEGHVDCTARAIQAVSAAAKRQIENAAKVDGHSCLIYRSKTHGRKCSCTRHRKAVTDMLRNDGTLSEDNLHRLLTDDQVGLLDYRNGQKPYNNVIVVDDDEPQPDVEADGNANTLLDDVDAAEAPAPIGSGDSPADLAAFMTGYSTGTRCAICYSTGRVGGYDLAGAFREVIDVTANIGTYLVEYDEEQTPIRMSAKPGSHIEFNLTIPRNSKRVELLRVGNNDRQIFKGWRLLVKKVNGNVTTWEEVADLLVYATGTPQTFRLTFSELTELTHLEVQVRLYDSVVPIDFSRITDSHNAQFLQFLGTVSLVVPPSVTSLPIQSVIVDGNTRRWMKCIDARDHRDRFGNIYSWEANCRLIHSQELDALLPLPVNFYKTNLGSNFKSPKFERRDTGFL